MSSPERMDLMERNIRHLALLVKQLGEFELANQESRLRNEIRMREWEQSIQESNQRIHESNQRIQESDKRIQESERRIQESERRIRELNEEMRRMDEKAAVAAENIRAMLAVVVEMQTDIARLDAAS